MVTFFIEGEPAPQGSKKYIGNGRMIENSKKLPAWRKAIKHQAQQAYDGEPLDLPLSVEVIFFLPKPKNPRFNVPATMPDADKLQRALGDGLEAAKVITNDSRIVHWDARKQYAQDKTGAQVTIKEAIL